MHFDNSYAKVDLNAIDANVDAVLNKTGVPVMVVVKADAYGHGAVKVARHLQAKCAFFGVASMLEALELRNAGIQKPILVFGPSHIGTFPDAVRKDIRLTIFRLEDAQALSAEAVSQNRIAKIHLAVDTGMGRIGMPVEDASVDLCLAIAKLPMLQIEGLFSHFASADCPDLSYATRQAELFDRFCNMLKDKNLTIPIRHINNSAGLMNFNRHYDMVRSGIITYGLYPSSTISKELISLKPAMQWISRISHIKTLPAGCGISYGSTFVTTQPTRVATVSVGYADGYSWSLSGKFHVLIRGKKAPILGRICMDQMMVDVTNIPDAAMEDPVILIGSSGKETITVEDVAAASGSFNYEFVCGIGHRVPRVYYQGEKQMDEVHYLLD